MHTNVCYTYLGGSMFSCVSSCTHPKNMRYFLHSLNSQVFSVFIFAGFCVHVVLQWREVSILQNQGFAHLELIWLILCVFFGMQRRIPHIQRAPHLMTAEIWYLGTGFSTHCTKQLLGCVCLTCSELCLLLRAPPLCISEHSDVQFWKCFLVLTSEGLSTVRLL